MKSLRIFLALFLFIFIALPLISEDYLIYVDFDERKLFLTNDIGIIIVAYSVALPGLNFNYLSLYGNVILAEKNPQVQIIIKFDIIDANPIFKIFGSGSDVSLSRKSKSGYIIMNNKDILQLIEIIEGKKTRVLFEK